MAKTTLAFTALDPRKPLYLKAAAVFAAVTLIGLGAAYYMEHHGHWVTGMNNQVVWGMPHVFAIFLIVAASGALNVASMASVFGRTVYKPLAPLSALLAVSLLAGGLGVLVLDLGRPDRLTVAMTHYNFTSIFAWNVILYNGFFVVVGVYLWTMLDKRQAPWSKKAGLGAFLWRLILTTGTGSIFGFLVARDAYFSAVMAPLFIAMSLSFGLAIFLFVMVGMGKLEDREVGDKLFTRLARLQAILIAAVAYFVAVQHLTALYTARGAEVERYLIGGDSVFSYLFWFGQILLGTVAPLILLLAPQYNRVRSNVLLAAGLVIVGGLVQMYVIVIGGQSVPMTIFPGMVVSSDAFDGMAANYAPTLWELLLGLGGMGIAMILVMVVGAALRILPESLSDAAVDPHHTGLPAKAGAGAKETQGAAAVAVPAE